MTTYSRPGQKGSKGKTLALGALFVTVLVLAGCANKDAQTFDGLYFRAKAGAVDKKETLSVFTVTVWKVSQSLDAARQAGGYEGTKYCIEKYGTSKIDWSVGPDTEPKNLTIVDDKLTFRGKCTP